MFFVLLCLDHQILLQLAFMEKQNEWPIVLVENIDHRFVMLPSIILFLNWYGNFPFGSLAKFVVYSYLHANVIDYVGTTTITINIKGTLIKTHFELIKKINYLTLLCFQQLMFHIFDWCKWVLLRYSKLNFITWLNNSAKEPPHFALWKHCK
jgi:hypothetical protein